MVGRVVGAVGRDDTLALEEASKVVVDIPLATEVDSVFGVLVGPGVLAFGSGLASQALTAGKELALFVEVVSSFLI